MAEQPDDAPLLPEESMLAAAEIAGRIASVHARLDSPDPEVRRIAQVLLHAHIMDLRSVLRAKGSTWETVLAMALVIHEAIESERNDAPEDTN